jgi:hypothetical protein
MVVMMSDKYTSMILSKKIIMLVYKDMTTYFERLGLDIDYEGSLKRQGDTVFIRSKIGRMYNLLCDQKLPLTVEDSEDINLVATLAAMQAFGHIVSTIGTMNNPRCFVGQVIPEGEDLYLVYGVK